MIVRFRPHHLLCHFCFQGKGYNKEFVENFKKIHAALNADSDNIIIEAVKNIDDLCIQCPANLNDCCVQTEKTDAMDQAVLKTLHLKFGDIFTPTELKARIKKYLTMDAFHKICGKCSWYPEKLCEPIIEKLLNAKI